MTILLYHERRKSETLFYIILTHYRIAVYALQTRYRAILALMMKLLIIARLAIKVDLWGIVGYHTLIKTLDGIRVEYEQIRD